MAAAVLKNRNGREERFDIAITIYTGQVWLGLRRADMRSVSWGLVRGGGGGYCGAACEILVAGGIRRRRKIKTGCKVCCNLFSGPRGA